LALRPYLAIGLPFSVCKSCVRALDSSLYIIGICRDFLRAGRKLKKGGIIGFCHLN